jgi:flavin reductase (DIM6/NTAB) family NADH-FMN oxidoreductase RutF
MEVCAIKFGPEVDELSEAGLATIPGQTVRSPRILAAPAALECRRHTTLQVGPAREIILGEVLGVYVRSDAVNPANLHIDQQLMDAVGRMGGHTYARTRDQFDIKTLTKEEWALRQEVSNAATA